MMAPYRHDHDPLNADFHGGECPACAWAEDQREEVDCPITAAIDNRDLLDEIAVDDDIPVYRRNQARQAVTDFDRALRGDDAL